MYDAPAPAPQQDEPRRWRWARLWYLLFWLLPAALVAWGGLDPPLMWRGASWPYPYRDVLLLCTIMALDTAALYWALGRPSAWRRAWLLGLLGGWVALGLGLTEGVPLSGYAIAFGAWSLLLLSIIAIQLLIVAVHLVRRRA